MGGGLRRRVRGGFTYEIARHMLEHTAVSSLSLFSCPAFSSALGPIVLARSRWTGGGRGESAEEPPIGKNGFWQDAWWK